MTKVNRIFNRAIQLMQSGEEEFSCHALSTAETEIIKGPQTVPKAHSNVSDKYREILSYKMRNIPGIDDKLLHHIEREDNWNGGEKVVFLRILLLSIVKEAWKDL